MTARLPVMPHGDDARHSHEVLLSDFAAHVRAVEGRAKRTADDYAEDARVFLRFLDRHYPGVQPNEVQQKHVSRYLVHEEGRGMSALTRRRRLYGLRTFLRYVAGGAEDAGTAADGVKVPKGPPTHTDVFTDSEIQRVRAHAAVQATLEGRLAATIVLTAWGTGLRRGELIGLRRQDLDLEARRLVVVGKGEVQRRVPIPPVLVEVLTEYLAEVRPAFPESPYVFANPDDETQERKDDQISRWVIDRLAKNFTKDAGVSGRRNLHKWRHTYATTVLRKTGDLHTVQRLLGHASIQTTLRYVHLVDDDLRNAVDKAFE